MTSVLVFHSRFVKKILDTKVISPSIVTLNYL